MARPKKRVKRMKTQGRPWVSRTTWPPIACGWALAFFAVLLLLSFQVVVKTAWAPGAPAGLIGTLFLLGITLLSLGYRRLPKERTPDLGRKAAWAILALLMAAGTFLRLYRLDHPPGTFWDDWATILVWVHGILDKDHFYWMLPTDGIEPFVPYVQALFLALLPESVPDFMIPRLTAALIDLAALWVLYLCGKELGSRRAGLAAAGLAALGRPMIQLSLTGMRAFSLSLAVSFLILASLKLFRKPSLGHFLLWGFAMAFGIHTYSSFRVFMIGLPLLLLPWVLRNVPQPRLPAAVGALGSLLLLTGIYSGTFNGMLALFQPWTQRWGLWVAHSPQVIAAFFVMTLASSALAAGISIRKGPLSRLAGWGLGLGLACLLVYPLTLSPQFDDRIANLSPFRSGDGASHPWAFLASQTIQTFRSLFFACADRNDLAIALDPFFDVFSQGALILGLAFLIVEPDWRKAFLVGMGGLGVAVYVISIDPASTKLLGCAPPAYLLAGWALSRLWDGLPGQKSDFRWGRVFLALFLSLYAAGGAWIQFHKLFGSWARNPGPDTVLAEHVRQDGKDHRIYLAPAPWFFGLNTQFVLNDGQRYYILKKTNRIPLAEGDSPEDIVLYVYGSAAKLIDELHRTYPSAQWEKIWVFKHEEGDPNPELYMWRVALPGPVVASVASPLLLPGTEKGAWLRRYFTNSYGWGLGGIFYEERTPDLGSPLPADLLRSDLFKDFGSPGLVRTVGSLPIAQEGDYEWSIGTPNPVWLRIDGRTLWKQDAPSVATKAKGKIHLTMGIHWIELRFRNPNGFVIPDIFLRPVGTAPWTKL
ncbi:MAG TPA: glycosyltransferase family 39 protein [bacterium]|nr:glycosyltransferase family 39 protein [bacterium]